MLEAYLFVLFVGLAAGAVSGVIGTGSSIMLLPVLVYAYGPKEAVPILAVAAVIGNLSRVMVWWREIDWRAFAAYSITGVPAAAFGARMLWDLPIHVINIGLGIFFLLLIPFRYWFKARNIHFSLWHLSVAGVFVGFLTGMVLSTGPLSVPVFTSYGLLKGAFLSTEAVSALTIYISKVVTFKELGGLPTGTLLKGLIVGSSLMCGTFIGKAIVMRMSIEKFHYVIDGLLFCSGLTLLWLAIH